MHAHDRVQLIFGQVNADLQNVMMENGHGRMLGSAGALGCVSGIVLSMYLGSARGVPGRLTSASVLLTLWGLGLVQVVEEVRVSFHVDASTDENDGLEWISFL